MQLQLQKASKTYSSGRRALRDWRWNTKDLSIKKSPALDEVNWSLGPGRIHGILGPNGSGKTTLLRILAKITALTSGKLFVDGRVVSVFGTEGALHSELQVGEGLRLQSSLYLVSGRQFAATRNAICEFGGLTPFWNASVRGLSSGMRARIVLSAALFSEWDIFLIDETFSALDVEFRWKCEQLIRQRVAEGASVVAVSHDWEWVSRFCHDATYLEAGRMVDSGRAAEVVLRQIQKLSSVKSSHRGAPVEASGESFQHSDYRKEERPTNRI